MELPPELHKLLPQALDVIRFLGEQPEHGAPLDTIQAGTGLGERALGKAIRRLVTRYYLDMPSQGYYVLTALGEEAAREIAASPPAPAPSVPPPPPDDVLRGDEVPPDDLSGVTPRLADGDTPRAADGRHTRTLTILMPKALVINTPTVLQAGFAPPDAGQRSLRRPARLVLRLTCPSCQVEPRDRPLEVRGGPAGPVRFRIVPLQTGAHHLTVEVFQLTTPDNLLRVGGMYFDLSAAELPTPQSAELQTVGASITLLAG